MNLELLNLFLELLDQRLRGCGFGRRRIGGDDFLRELDRGVLVAFVHLHERQLEHRLAPGGIEIDRLLVPLRRFIRLPLGEFHLAEVVEDFTRRVLALDDLCRALRGNAVRHQSVAARRSSSARQFRRGNRAGHGVSQ